MNTSDKVFFAEEEVRKNFNKTVLCFFVFVGIILGLSYFLGYLLNAPEIGLKIGFLTCLIVIPVELIMARWSILTLTGCIELDPNNPAEARILRIVQNISISAGLAIPPKVYLIPVKTPNAFAAGWNPETSFIGITTGLADLLDDSELEGVIAHEISHIVHRDVMTMQFATAMVSGALLLAFFIQCIVALKEERGVVSLIVFVFICPITLIISLTAFFFISRKREFASDAFAVRLCSYNQGLIGALEKLSANTEYSEDEINQLGGNALSALYFVFPGSIFSTHPPIEERINRLKNMY